MERCATCKWWGITPDMDRVYTYEGTLPQNWRICLRTYREHWTEPPPERALLAVAGYEFDGLATAPDFGCVQHEQKDTQP